MAVLLLEGHLNRLFEGAGLHPEQLRACRAHPEAIHEHRHLDVFMDPRFPCLHERKGTYRKMLIQHLLPAVLDTQLVAAAAKLGLSIELCCQPPNSPDLNCLDLSLFSAIQARQRLRTPRSIEELVEAVKAAYWDLPPSTINAAFLSLQGSMDLCILGGSGNAFKPLGKAKLQQEGRLPESVQCSPETAVIMSQLRTA
ncbi:hypothetical protein C6341_g27437 [Phytophthora cactorum]|nr:hypothetical protein C6341_g27437 [Phytophthora cactorum]